MPVSKAFPVKLDTVGDHIRAARLQRGLEQGKGARILGVTKSPVRNWESRRSSPTVHPYKGVIEFIGYDPFPKSETLSGQLVTYHHHNVGR